MVDVIITVMVLTVLVGWIPVTALIEFWVERKARHQSHKRWQDG